jgi:pyruvate dehydrogenase E2 component (dihydrolipoamide acetyltransferase)
VRTDAPGADAPAETVLQTSEKQAATPITPPAEKKDTPRAPDVPAASDDDTAGGAKVYAGPATRRLARELGVSLVEVKGTGSRQRITKDDVKAYVKQQMAAGKPAAHTAAGLPQVAEIDFAKFGPVETVALTRIQQRGADNLHRSWVNLPHVTQHDETDITDLEAFRQSLKQDAERKGVKITPLAFIIKACCHALLEFPNFNASLHADRKQLVLKQYINVGMAVDTPEGLVVPVIKAANEKSIWQLSAEIAELSDKARNKKLAMDDLQGGTFSVSSLGALGGTGFTPIINAPEVAILGVSKLQTKPLWDGERFVPRKVLPLSLSYDHRVINGADGGRFMNYLTTVLADIRRLAL